MKKLVLGLVIQWILVSIASAQTSTLSVEVKVPMKSGDEEPVAGQELRLLDADLTSLPSTQIPAEPMFIMVGAFAQLYLCTNAETGLANPERCKGFLAELDTHTVQKAVTDSDGKAVFESVPFGSYVLVAAVSVEENRMFAWHDKVDLKSGHESFTLDNSNAALQP